MAMSDETEERPESKETECWEAVIEDYRGGNGNAQHLH